MQVVLAKCLMSLGGRRDRSSLHLFQQIHCDAVSIGKDKQWIRKLPDHHIVLNIVDIRHTDPGIFVRGGGGGGGGGGGSRSIQYF